MNYTTNIRLVHGFRQGLQKLRILDKPAIYCFPPLSLLMEFLFSFRNNTVAQPLMSLRRCHIIYSGMIMFLFIFLLAIYALIRRLYNAFLHLMFFNILLNGYPVLLQRYNRFRLDKVMKLRDSIAIKRSNILTM